MAITMQGPWTVSVKSKSAAFAQRFVISGAAFNNGPHAGTPGSTLFATGAQWSINIQSQAPAQPWIDSAQRLTFPSVSGGVLRFTIRSDDTGGDKDFNDLVLECSMPLSASDFVVYGNVKTYWGACLFNPCYPWYFVIDKYVAFLQALQIPELRRVIERLYPERIPRRGPLPDPPPDFKPLVIPTGAAIENHGLVFRSVRPRLTQAELASGGNEKEFLKTAVSRLQGTAHPVALDGAPLAAGFGALEKSDLTSIAKLIDGSVVYMPCFKQPAPGLLLGFQEYDRTNAEKLGGPYTGTGPRQNLGLTATDEQGNYIFRFSQSLSDIIEESTDVAPGESFATQIFPDVIVQALGTGMSVDYESAPHYNIPNLVRINLCLPYETVHPNRECADDRVIQRIGDVIVLHSSLSGSPNTLDGQGRITCRNANAPQVDCAAWRGGLRMYACLGNTQVTSYTLRYMRSGIDTGWQFVSEAFALNHIPDFAPGYTGTPVGPTNRFVHVDGGAAVERPTYTNHEGDSNWIENDLKLILSSGLYRPVADPGSVDFRIQGYDSAGNFVAGVDDTLTLYIDNRATKGDIASITMGNVTLDDCALFSLTSGNAPLSLRYRAVDPEGFVRSWSLSAIRGNNNSVSLAVVGGVVPKGYPPAPNPCTSFRGTIDDPSSDIDGYVTTSVQPSGGANWLPAGRNFCAFAFTLTADDRVTDGRTAYPLAFAWTDVIGLSTSP